MTNSPSPPCLSKLQQLLKLSHSENHSDQQEAVIELSKFVDGTSIAVDSFGPLAHALCRLLPSPNRTVASYSARTIKFLVLDDTLRPQAMAAGVHAVVCGLLNKWEDEILCLRELLGILQTLTWDKQCVKGVLQCSIIDHLIDYIQVCFPLNFHAYSILLYEYWIGFGPRNIFTFLGYHSQYPELCRHFVAHGHNHDRSLRGGYSPFTKCIS